MRRLISSSTVLVALVSCLFILPACDSGGSNGSGGNSGGGGGSGGEETVTATSENSFEFTFSSGSSQASKDPEKISGFAFSWSGETPEGDKAYAIYFSSKKTFDPDAFSSSSGGPKIAGFLVVKGSQNPDGNFPIVDFQTQNDLSSGQSWGMIVTGFDEPENEGTRTVQFFTDGSLDFSSGDVTGFNSVSATELFVDFTGDTPETQFTEGVGVSLSGTINPAEGASFLEENTFTISTSN